MAFPDGGFNSPFPIISIGGMGALVPDPPATGGGGGSTGGVVSGWVSKDVSNCCPFCETAFVHYNITRLGSGENTRNYKILAYTTCDGVQSEPIEQEIVLPCDDITCVEITVGSLSGCRTYITLGNHESCTCDPCTGGSIGDPVQTECCENTIPAILQVTIDGPCAGTYTMTWDGEAWRADLGAGGPGCCSILDLSCTGTDETGFYLQVDFDAMAPTVTCSPFSATYSGPPLGACGLTSIVISTITE